VGEVGHHRHQDGNCGGVVDEPRDGADRADGRAQLAGLVVAGERRDLPSQYLDRAGSLDA
jgi:hypothetical protein